MATPEPQTRPLGHTNVEKTTSETKKKVKHRRRDRVGKNVRLAASRILINLSRDSHMFRKSNILTIPNQSPSPNSQRSKVHEPCFMWEKTEPRDGDCPRTPHLPQFLCEIRACPRRQTNTTVLPERYH